MRQVVVLHPISGLATAPIVMIDPGDDLLLPDGLVWGGGWVLQSVISQECYAQKVAVWVRSAFPREGDAHG
jgi:hypothetical protein